MTRPDGRIDHTLVFYKKYLLLYGGIAKKKIYNDLRVFDIEKEKW